MSEDEIRDLRTDLKEAAAVALKAKNLASQNAGMLESLRKQTESQWDRLETVSRTMERAVTVLDRVVQDQAKLEAKLELHHDTTTRRVADHETAISEARGGMKAFKWLAAGGGGAGLIAAVKAFLFSGGPPPS